MNNCKIALLLMLILSLATNAAEDRVELETTIIKGNTELPKILYVVPWKDIDGKSDSQQKLHLHSLFGDLFDPLTPITPDLLKTNNAKNEVKED